MSNVGDVNSEKIDLSEGYENVRFRLLRSSYVLHQLASAIRDKYKIKINNAGDTNWREVLRKDYLAELARELSKFDKFPEDSKNPVADRTLRMLLAETAAGKRVVPEVSLIAEKLAMSEEYLRVFVLYNNRTYKVDGPHELRFMQAGQEVRQSGVYLKLDNVSSYKELKEVFFRYKELYRKTKMHKKVIAKGDNWKLNAYIRVEQELIYCSDPRNPELFNMYEKNVAGKLNIAIERVAGDLFPDSEMEDDVADKVPVRIRDAYYDVINRYKLPRVRQLSKLLRLINC